MASLFGEHQNCVALSTLRSQPMMVRRIAEQRAEDSWRNVAATHGKLIARAPVYPLLTDAGGTQHATQLSDDELLAIVGRCSHLSEVDALSLLYDRYHQMLYALAYRMVMDIQIAEDLLQETFIAVWRRAGSYSVQCGSVRTWLFSIIHHRTIDYLRQSQRYPTVSTLSSDELEHADALLCADAWEETWRTIQGAHVRQALARLPVAQRNVIELAYFQGWTHNEIAKECHLPLGTVKARMRLGLAHLRRLLAELEIYGI